MRETKVGVVVFLALALLGGMVFLTGGTFFSKKGYVLHALFSDARGLVPGAPVFVSGVERGVVQKLTVEPSGIRATLLLARDIRIPEDSTFTITTSGLLGNPNIRVSRGISPVFLSQEQTVSGDLPPSFESVLAEVRGDFDEFRKTFQHLNAIIGDPVRQERLRETIDHLPSLVQDGRSTLAQITAAAHDVRELLQETQHALHPVIRRTEDLLRHADALVQENRNPLRESMARLQAILIRVDDILAEFDVDHLSGQDLRRAVVNVARAAASVEDLVRTAEQQLFRPTSGDGLPETIAQVRKAVTKAQTVLEDIESFRVEGRVGLHSTSSGHRDDDNRGMVDASFWFGREKSRFAFTLGVEDVGSQEAFTAAPGYRVPWGRLWAGIVRGHAGVGLLWRPAPQFPIALQGQWWDEAGGSWAAEAQVDLTPSLGLFFKHLERESEPRQSIGISYRF